jgi:hypothetical protein
VATPLITAEANGPFSIHAADLDGDGDLDVLSASSRDGTIAWYENADGLGQFGPRQVITRQTFSARLVFAADVDGDGDVDLLAASDLDDKVVWYENLSTEIAPRPVGDANEDGRFDRLDIQQVLESARYRTGEPAAWYEGDWNRDGVFDQLDLIFALAGGSYGQDRDAFS